MMTESDDRNNQAGVRVTVSRWGPTLTLCLTILGGFLAGYWYLGAILVDGINANVAALRSETGQRFDGREAEDRDIRALIRDTTEAMRAEIGRLGDRLVESNREVGAQIDQMRNELVATMKDGDDRLERRFDRLDEKFDTLLTKIDYEIIEIPWGHGIFSVEKTGAVVGEDGKELGTLPAVIRFDQP